MAWIKVTHELPDKPEVLEITQLVGRVHAEVLGALVLTWIWWDQQSRNGHANVTLVSANCHLLRVTGVPELASALVKVGWLRDHTTHIELVNFDRHMSESAKKRALASRRKQRERCHADVTLPSRTERDKNVTREEKISSLRVSSNEDTLVELSSATPGNGRSAPHGTNGKKVLPFSPNDLAEGYNECVAIPFGLPSVTTPLSAGRSKNARARIREHPSEDWWNAVFSQYATSRFLRGECGQQGWRGGTFDFLVRNAENPIKTHEGAYKDQPVNTARR